MGKKFFESHCFTNTEAKQPLFLHTLTMLFSLKTIESSELSRLFRQRHVVASQYL